MNRDEWFDREFLEHAAKTPSQYDSTCRRMAQQILDLTPVARPAIDWHEDRGEVLWWRLPIVEPPYVGSPLHDDWTPGYYTHWTPIVPPVTSDSTPPKSLVRDGLPGEKITPLLEGDDQLRVQVAEFFSDLLPFREAEPRARAILRVVDRYLARKAR